MLCKNSRVVTQLNIFAKKSLWYLHQHTVRDHHASCTRNHLGAFKLLATNSVFNGAWTPYDCKSFNAFFGDFEAVLALTWITFTNFFLVALMHITNFENSCTKMPHSHAIVIGTVGGKPKYDAFYLALLKVGRSEAFFGSIYKCCRFQDQPLLQTFKLYGNWCLLHHQMETNTI